MGTEFLRLRRKNALWRLMRALLAGIAVALLVTGGLLVLFKLTGPNGHLPLSAGVGLAAGLAVAVVRWLLLRRSDLRAAEQIDAEHGLRERVQTMVAFREEDSAMLQLQRQDTEEKLKAVGAYGVSRYSVLAHLGAVVLAVAVLIGGMILPARAGAGKDVYVEPDFNASEWQKASLEALIAHVRESDMGQPAKDETMQRLQDLRDTLDSTMSVSAFKAIVIEAIEDVYSYTDRINSNDDLYEVIILLEHDLADDVAYVSGKLGNASLGGDVEDIGVQLGKNKDTIGLLADGLQEQLALIPANYLADNRYDETDGLYCALLNFVKGLHSLEDHLAAGGTEEAFNSLLGDVIHVFKNEANLALELQTASKEECVYVVETLCSIFGISASECPQDPDPEYSKKLEDDEYTESSGGAGTGDMQFAGDEQVYDYKQDQHVSYTDLVAEYYAAMTQASLEGEFDEETEDFIFKYFSQLYTG